MIALPLALMLAGGGQFDVPPLAERDLADQRGGFNIPGGVDVALTVDTVTAVDGAVVLRTIFRADQGTPTLSIYAPRAGETVAARPAASEVEPGTSVSYDPRTGIQVSRGGALPSVSASGDRDVAGLVAVAPGTVTDAGRIEAVADERLQRVTLTGSDLTVAHLAGGAFGAAIANTGNDRAIDTQTSVAIDLSGAAEVLAGSALLRVDALTADVMRGRL